MPPFNPTDPTGPYIVQGIPLEPGENPGIRRELRDFAQDKPAWNMYLLGLWQFQLVPQERVLSYFQIAGIHGLPYKSWPENDSTILGRAREKEFKSGGGFCTHSSILFLTWHRPYLALFEDVLRQAMIHVAEQFTDEEDEKKEYLEAAKKFRMPFWDWARPGHPVFPTEATEEETTEVHMPKILRQEYPQYDVNGVVKIPNPLYSYKFRPGTDGRINRYKGDSTARYPELDGEGQATLKQVLEAYTNGYADDKQLEINLSERLVYLLQSYDLFSKISANAWDDDHPGKDQDETEVKGGGFGSFEDIHNSIHGLIGGGGHMSGIAVSAFDPIFWLHHTNIDRLLDIWQGLREDPDRKEAWVTPQKVLERFPNWAKAPGDIEDIETDLLPFYKASDAFWNSNDVRETKTFGYAYPDTFKNNQRVDRGTLREDIRRLYPAASLANIALAKRAGNSEPETALKNRAILMSEIEKADAPNTSLTGLRVLHAQNRIAATELHPILEPVDIPTIQIPSQLSVLDLIKNETYLEWLVNIKAQKHALGGSYQVHVFLGKVPDEEPTVLYPTSPHHVGTFVPLGQSGDTACGKCKKDQSAALEITGQIPLTIALVERYFAGKLTSLDPDCVQSYLKEHLHWEVVNKDGQRLKNLQGRNKVDGLLVGVISNEVTLPSTADGFPSYSEYVTIYPAITTKAVASQGGRAEGTGVTEENKKYCC